ncbi:MAG: hypothetical protein IRY98_08900, partial [Alicyclobacillaceae bacterium]|nr:hypothetical protein [Alicyclobacillaceae bacterium]
MGRRPVSRKFIFPISMAVILGVPGVPALATDGVSTVSVDMPAIPASPAPGGKGQASSQDVSVTVDAAKKAVMDAFAIPQTDGMTFSYSFETGGPDGRRLWHLGWQMPPRANGGGEGFNASVDADTGAIVSYQHWRDAERALPPSVSRDQARETAKALIEKLQPQQFRETAEWPTEDVYGPLGIANYAFSFVRVHNGIPFPMDGFHVVVGKDGQIVSYQFGWSNVSFPDVQPSLSRGEAQSKLAETLAVSAHY